MRKLLIIAAVAAMTFASTNSAEAGRRNRGYTRSRTTWSQPSRGGGFFSRMMELERRKNAMIFGR